MRTPRTEKEAKQALLGKLRRHVYVALSRGTTKPKVPVGTMGQVCWMGAGEYGPRVGVVVEGHEKVIYTAAKNVDIVYPGLKPHETPVGGWRGLWERNMNLPRPRKGQRIRHVESGKEGKVFWAGGIKEGNGLPFLLRVGFHLSGSNAPIWCNLEEVVGLCLRDGVVKYTLFASATPAPKWRRYDRFWPPIAPALVAHLPPPFCDIRTFAVEHADNPIAGADLSRFVALNDEGKDLCVMSPDQKRKFLEGIEAPTPSLGTAE